MSLKYEPFSELLHIAAKQLHLNRSSRFSNRVRAIREQLQKVKCPLSGFQGWNLAMTALPEPYSLERSSLVPRPEPCTRLQAHAASTITAEEEETQRTLRSFRAASVVFCVPPPPEPHERQTWRNASRSSVFWAVVPVTADVTVAFYVLYSRKGP